MAAILAGMWITYKHCKRAARSELEDQAHQKQIGSYNWNEAKNCKGCCGSRGNDGRLWRIGFNE